MELSSLKQFFSEVIITANDVLDFPAHSVLVFDAAKKGFRRKQWHYLAGDYVPRRRFDQKKTLLRILQSRRASIDPRERTAFDVDGEEQSDTSGLYVPLYIAGEPVGLLSLFPPEGQHFTSYDAFIADCIASVVASGFSKAYDCRAPLRFCMLQRRQFLAAEPSVGDLLHESLGRILGRVDFPMLPRNLKASGNIRIATNKVGADEAVTLRYASFLFPRSVSRMGAAAEERSHRVSKSRIEKWCRSWAQFSRQLPADIDSEYPTLFPAVQSHVAVPCLYRGQLYGIISVDSPVKDAFDPAISRALCVLGAQLGPVLKAAMEREQLQDERRNASARMEYLQAVLDAIPDEVSIIDSDCRILMMNREKRNNFPAARLQQRCFEAFESGKNAACEGCYTLQALHTGTPVRQALWKYIDIKTRKTRYVEISAGKIITGQGEPNGQAVEVDRPVDARETMLEWLAEVHRDLVPHLDDPKAGRDWLWDRINDGLLQMGFKRVRLYTFEDGRFRGKACRPSDVYQGHDFTTFCLDPAKDLPSKVLIEEPQFRPVRFCVDPELDEAAVAEQRERTWNYTTYYLQQIPPTCNEHLDKGDIWVDVPIGVLGSLYGKVSVDKGKGAVSDQRIYVTDFEISLLAAFGRFASLAMELLVQAARFIDVRRMTTLLDFEGRLAHELDNCLLGLGGSLRELGESFSPLIAASRSAFSDDLGGEYLPLVEQIHGKLSKSHLLLPNSYSIEQRQRVSRLQEHAARAGVMGSRFDDLVLFVLADLDAEFIEIAEQCKSSQKSEALSYVVNLAKSLSRLETALDRHDMAAKTRVNLSVHAMFHPDTIKPTSIEDSVEAAIRIVRAGFGTTGEIRFLKPRKPLPPIDSYAASLRLAWVNLLKNAVIASAGAGRIFVRMRRRGDWAKIQIKDLGRGLPAEIIELIEAPTPARTRFDGRNLGLSTTKAIVAAHHGEIRVVATGTNGTTLEVTLPLKEFHDDKASAHPLR